MRVGRAGRVALFVLAALSIACSDGSPDSTDLAGRLAALDVSDAFTMTYRAAGTDVLGCVQPNRSFAIDVAGDRFVVRRLDDDVVLAERDGERLRINGSLFDASTTGAEWIEADLGVLEDGQAAALRRALGPDLTGYVLAADPPASGLEQASSLLPLASSIQVTEIEGEATTFSLLLDPDAYVEATGAGAAVAPPLVHIDLNDEQVTRIVVLPPGDEAAGGWTIDFPASLGPVADRPAAGTTVDLEELDVSQLRAAPLEGCAVGDETPATDP